LPVGPVRPSREDRLKFAAEFGGNGKEPFSFSIQYQRWQAFSF
jgi:hypothetical protein